MEMSTYDHGVPSWVDVSATDLSASRDFYEKVFGWNVPEGPPEQGGYSLAEVNGKDVAGVGPQMDPNAPPSWTTYVNVENADAIIEKINENGGNVVMGPMDVMDKCRIALFLDPQGALLGITEPRTHRGAQLVNEVNTYTWSELVTSDPVAAAKFYSAVFGWDPKSMKADENAREYFGFNISDRPVAGMDGSPSQSQPGWSVFFGVDDLDAAMKKVHEAGGSIVEGPTQIEPGPMSVGVDPSGARFSILQMKS